jgi:hypothetical protein
MIRPFELLDVVALNADLPNHGLVRGQVGTIVELLSQTDFEVEFSDDQGKTYALLPLSADQLLLLHTRPVAAS